METSSLIHLPPLAAALIGIAALLFMILRLKVQAFVALLITSIITAFLAGMPLTEINAGIQKGMGGILGFIATIIGLGAIFGKLLEISGGTQVLADSMLKLFGLKRASWAMMLTGFVISIPVFFDAGLVILIPVIYALSRQAKRPILYFGIPLLAGMTITHSFVPPTPGPIAVAELLGADLGWVILFGVICGLPASIVAGPIFGAWVAKRIQTPAPELSDVEQNEVAEHYCMPEHRPRVFAVLALIGLPIFLILVSSVATTLEKSDLFSPGNMLEWIQFLGHPFTALILATIACMVYLRFHCKLTKDQIGKAASSALAPAGLIILITGAGGVFKQILIDSNAAGDLASMLQASHLPVILLAYFLAATVRVVQGSATVAMITAASILAPIIVTTGMQPSQPQLALWVLSVAAGSMVFSHVNDSGFWLVSRYFGLSEKQTFLSWSLMTTLVSLCGFLTVVLLDLLI